MDPLHFDRLVLRCGAETLWQHRSDVAYTLIGVVVRTGALSDPDNKAGLAHLLEHIPFEGTSAYPTNYQLSSRVESEGGQFDAATADNFTYFYVKMPVWQCTIAWEVLEQMLFHPILDERVVANQIKDIINENAADANEFPPEINIDRMTRRLFGPTLAKRVAGYSGTLAAIRLADILKHHRLHYRPNNMVIVATGDLSHFPDSWPLFLASKLGHWPKSQPTVWPPVPVTTRSRPDSWVTKRHDEPYPRLVIAVRIHLAVTANASEMRSVQHTANLASHILTGGESSLLYQQVREKNTLAYDGGGAVHNMTPAGMYWTFQATTQDLSHADQLAAILHGILSDPGICTDELVELGKRGVAGQFAMSDWTAEKAFLWAVNFLPQGGTVPSREEWGQQFDRVSPDEVRRMLADDFRPEHWITILYHP